MRELKYMTVEQCELYRKLVEKYDLKGYLLPSSIACQTSYKKEIGTPIEQKSSKRRK